MDIATDVNHKYWGSSTYLSNLITTSIILKMDFRHQTVITIATFYLKVIIQHLPN